MTLLKDLLASQKESLISKSTMENKKSILSAALGNTFVDCCEDAYTYLYDFDEDFAYFEIYDYEFGLETYWKVAYATNGTDVSFSETAERVVRRIEWVDFVPLEETSTEKSVLRVLTKFFGHSQDNTQQVIKQFNEEQMIAIEPLYICAGDVDGHGATISLDEMRGMVGSLNKAIDDGTLQSCFFHTHQTETFTIEKAWINEAECLIGDSLVKEGQPIVKVQFNDKDAWELRKNGELQGLSIGAKGVVEAIEND